MQPESNQFLEARCARYEMSIIIDATRERVWRGLTDQLHAWWLPDFHMLGEESKITFEPFAGGRLFEEAGGRSLLWYTVLSYDPLKSMEWAGFCTAKYGGPATTLLSLELHSVSSQRMRLQVSDSLFGSIHEGLLRSLQSGWELLFTQGLKKFVESND
jgi:hypothetical protein